MFILVWRKPDLCGRKSARVATKVKGMELETLFTASKWEILKLLAQEPLSPLELAARSSTSIANISQQLRLLEMAGLVVSERIPNRDKGLPRLKYRLAADQSFLIATANDFVEKKLLKLSDYNKVILRIWFHDDPEVRYALEKAFWSVEHRLPEMRTLGVHAIAEGKIELCVCSESLDEKDLKTLALTTPAGNTYAVAFKLSRKPCARNEHLLYERPALPAR